MVRLNLHARSGLNCTHSSTPGSNLLPATSKETLTPASCLDRFKNDSMGSFLPRKVINYWFPSVLQKD